MIKIKKSWEIPESEVTPESIYDRRREFMITGAVGTAMLFPTVSALVSHRAPRSELGQTLGVQQSFGGVARVIAPLWATAAFQLGMTLPYFIASGVVALAILLAFSVKPAVPFAAAA